MVTTQVVRFRVQSLWVHGSELLALLSSHLQGRIEFPQNSVVRIGGIPHLYSLSFTCPPSLSLRRGRRVSLTLNREPLHFEPEQLQFYMPA
jgi:hypothetical protein